MASGHRDEDCYSLGRNRPASLRLTKQHKLFTQRAGGLLRPRVEEHLLNSKHSVIADVGCGNGAWLFEVAECFRDTAQLIGLDISLAMIPPAKDWPGNCTFDILNIAAPLPGEYVGRFDVVNIRLLAAGLREHDADTVIKNLLWMLKPGGRVQWLDITRPYVHAFKVEADDSILIEEIKRLGIVEQMAKNTGSLKWLPSLPSLLARHFIDVETRSCPLIKTQLEDETHNFLQALDEMRQWRRSNTESTTRNIFEDAVTEAHLRASEGVQMTLALQETSARKPEANREIRNEQTAEIEMPTITNN